jgi:hypothetical protein
MTTPIARTRANVNGAKLVNPLYEVLKAKFENVFSNLSPLVDYFDPALYVSTRTHSPPKIAFEGLLSRLPEDVRSEVNDGVLGFYELDILDFIINYKTAKVCSLVGSVGTGKTTLLKYFSFFLQNHLSCLRGYRIIYVDFFSIDRFDNRPKFLLKLISIAILDAFKNVSKNYDRVSALTEKANDVFDFTVIDLTSYIKDVKSAVGADLVFAFDNLDLLSPDEVVEVSTFARSVYFATNQAVIIALRPSSDTIRIEYARDKGAFFPFVLNIAPPRLVDVIWRRFDKVINNMKSEAIWETAIVDAHGFTISISDTEYRVRTLFENVITSDMQELLLRKICNNNVRQSLIAFKNFIRHRDLSFNLIFDFREQSVFPYSNMRRSAVPKFSHFLKGIMVSDLRCYTEIVQDSVVENIFYFSPPDLASSDHILQYYSLSLLGLLDKQVSVDRICSHLDVFNYSPTVIRRCLSKLLKRGLLSSPEGINPEWPRHVKITETGQYYLEHLCTHTTYLLNVVADVDVSFDPPAITEVSHFSAQLHALSQLVELVLDEELAILSAVEKSNAAGEHPIRVAITKYRPISLRLWEGFQKLALQKPRDLQRISKLVEANERIFSLTIKNCTDKIGQLSNICGRFAERSRIEEIIQQKSIDSELPGLGRVEVLHPPRISSLAPNRVEISFIPSFRIVADEIVGEWHAEDGDFYARTMFYMTRNSRRGPFKGAFEIGHMTKDISFPIRSTITFFQDDGTLGRMQLRKLVA